MINNLIHLLTFTGYLESEHYLKYINILQQQKQQQ